ncbi:peptide/nickel transport system permease protein [Herbihabitans rhizosphaerae]|uniref:Peptide/nickel transport system permease protein n=1 Tax=Herbihabitans rhizosphaerae TaxID=1872711 RepID=A0A4Q7L7Z6_9PSEU|nr:ABC transporter permease [Herbihabitans rhizosphaerae]RZS45030.1 peptide/nickel transport system permease protein [Herbihabitans rhizosphaerae]
MTRLLITRTLGIVGTLLVLSVVIFAATELLPGDAVSRVAGPQADPVQRALVAERLGLDRPAIERYVDWVGSAFGGDLGTSLTGRRPVAEIVGDRLGNSLLLAAAVYLPLIPLAVLLGTAAGLGSVGGRRGRLIDRVISFGTLAVLGVPEFLIAGLLLAVFAVWLHLFPPVSMASIGGSVLDTPEILVLPALSLLIVSLGAVIRLVRARAADVATSPYVESARLAGVRGPALVLRHVMPAVLGPAVQLIAVGFGTVVGGAVVVETLFDYPGIGNELQNAVASRDVPVVQGIALTLGAVTLIAVLAGDLVGRALDGVRR